MMLFAPNDPLQIVTNFKAIIGNKCLIQPIIGVTFGLCKVVKKTQMGPTFVFLHSCPQYYTTSKLFFCKKIIEITLAD